MPRLHDARQMVYAPYSVPGWPGRAQLMHSQGWAHIKCAAALGNGVGQSRAGYDRAAEAAGKLKGCRACEAAGLQSLQAAGLQRLLPFKDLQGCRASCFLKALVASAWSGLLPRPAGLQSLLLFKGPCSFSLGWTSFKACRAAKPLAFEGF